MGRNLRLSLLPGQKIFHRKRGGCRAFGHRKEKGHQPEKKEQKELMTFRREFIGLPRNRHESITP